MKREKNRSRNKNKSASRHKNIKVRKKDIKIRSKDSNIRKRSKNRLKKQKMIYLRRRILLLLLLIFILFFLINLIIKRINRYESDSYPKFRDQVMESITKDIFIANTEDRSLTSAEKISDFNKLNDYIIRNYAIDSSNEENYNTLIDQTEIYKKRIKNCRSDQEFYDIISSYLSLLQDNRTKIIDKKSYQMIFPYYKEKNKSPRAKNLGDAQVVNRYKRLLGRMNEKKELEIKENKNTLEIYLPDFDSNNINRDKEKIKSILINNPNIQNIFIDLSNNESIDDKYANEILPLLIHKDYALEKIVFYRGNLLKQSLAYMKNNKDRLNTRSSFVQNQSIKFPEDTKEINKDYYMYYDQIRVNINKDKDIGNKKIYILTNENTKNDPIRFANILKTSSDAYLVKNGFEGNQNQNDIIYNLRSDIFKLDHSGFLISINSSKSLNEDDKFIKYNQTINSSNPIKEVLKIIK